MTQRERHASAGLSATVAAPITIGAAAATLLPPRAADGNGSKEVWWEELYRSASPAQQQELLTLAGRQGLLYAHQLPAPAPVGGRSEDRPPTGAAGDSRNLRLLSQALTGQVEELPAVNVEPIPFPDD